MLISGFSFSLHGFGFSYDKSKGFSVSPDYLYWTEQGLTAMKAIANIGRDGFRTKFDLASFSLVNEIDLYKRIGAEGKFAGRSILGSAYYYIKNNSLDNYKHEISHSWQYRFSRKLFLSNYLLQTIAHGKGGNFFENQAGLNQGISDVVDYIYPLF